MRTPPPLLCAALAVILLGGCASGTDKPSADDKPHGYVEGAEETAEPQRRLVMAEAETGTLSQLDPATEKTAELADVKGVAGLVTDGRYVFAAGKDKTSIIDSGVWTVDHGDHKHYYVAEAKPVDTVDIDEAVSASADAAVSTVNTPDGAHVYDREQLADGKIAPVDTEAALAVPYAGELVTATDGRITVADKESDLDASCPRPTAAATTDRGAVFGCGERVVVVTEKDGTFSADELNAPAGIAAAQRFQHRPGTPVLVTAAKGEVTVFDVAEGDWSVIDAPDPVAVNATGEDMPVLVLDRDGTLRSFDQRTGDPIAERRVIDKMPKDGPAPVITVDTERAYVNDPEAKAVHEIDFQDELRLARSLTLDTRPDLMVETGS
ncbi:hypothetical protein [Stackebrandtia nassauensis]|uniref:Lipoprotein n=1 Tax=Stackebrandtia nassauensis (strain DSM 44728 / CIP 108903 / NRRL B-16338 / NBRC 102104 / LLR-40K-21) TaxID=446470 RepID=D3Q420_STANL|nr:hypothetical protein [Stackebrandtia nassauensis]ADD45905.1 hypothetical protein Snas_6285 [Stackebrandtia nassauensis DSM 44728]